MRLVHIVVGVLAKNDSLDSGKRRVPRPVDQSLVREGVSIEEGGLLGDRP